MEVAVDTNGSNYRLETEKPSQGSSSLLHRFHVSFGGAVPLPSSNGGAARLKELESSLDKVLFTSHLQPTSVSLLRLYKLSEELCLLGLEQEACRRVAAIMERFAIESVACLEVGLSQATMESRLQTLRTISERFVICLDVLQKVLSPLDREFVEFTSLGSLKVLLCSLFRSHVEKKTEVLRVAINAALFAVGSQRQADAIDDDSCLNCVAAFSRFLDDLQLYKTHLEEAVLRETESFYQQAAEREIFQRVEAGTFDLASFVDFLNDRLNLEQRVCAKALLEQSITQVLGVVRRELLQRHVLSVLYGTSVPPTVGRDRGFYSLLVSTDRSSKAAESLVELLTLTDQLGELRTCWQQCLRAEGLRIVQEQLGIKVEWGGKHGSSIATADAVAPVETKIPKTSTAVSFFVDLFKFKARVAAFETTVFKGEAAMLAASKNAWEDFLNVAGEVSHCVAAALAKYTDHFLRTATSSSAPPMDHTTEINRAMAVFKLLHTKDLFKKLYRRDMARRLLSGRTTDNKLEWAIVRRLKSECGAAFTAKMESFLEDVEYSHSLMREFCDASGAMQPEKFDCIVVAASLWPFAQKEETPANNTTSEGSPASCKTNAGGSSEDLTHMLETVPAQLQSLKNSYAEFYETKHKSSCTLFAVYPNGKQFELVASQLQAFCLLLFNDRSEYALSELCEILKVEASELQRQLLALHGDTEKPILIKNGMSYVLNSDFTSRSRRIVIAQVTRHKGQKAEFLEAERQTKEDRSHFIDALIVRTMKAKKKALHTELVEAVLSNNHFKLEVSLVKARIESLIEREFLERDSENLLGLAYTKENQEPKRLTDSALLEMENNYEEALEELRLFEYEGAGEVRPSIICLEEKIVAQQLKGSSQREISKALNCIEELDKEEDFENFRMSEIEPFDSLSIKALDPGDVVASVTPLALAPSLSSEDSRLSTVCHHCLSFNETDIRFPCPLFPHSCSFTFCSPSCVLANIAQHRQECHLLTSLIFPLAKESGFTPSFVILVLRTLINVHRKNSLAAIESDDFFTLMELLRIYKTSSDTRPWLSRCTKKFAACLDAYLPRSLLLHLSTDKIEDLITLIHSNALPLANSLTEQPVGIAFCPSLCSFNHSCIPNCCYAFEQNKGLAKVTIRAISALKENSVLTLSYLRDLMLPRHKRKHLESSSKVLFCDCLRCRTANEDYRHPAGQRCKLCTTGFRDPPLPRLLAEIVGLQNSERWVCNRCKDTSAEATLSCESTEQALGALVQTAQLLLLKGNKHEARRTLEKSLLKFHRLLHPNHWLIYTIHVALAGLASNCQVARAAELLQRAIITAENILPMFHAEKCVLIECFTQTTLKATQQSARRGLSTPSLKSQNLSPFFSINRAAPFLVKLQLKSCINAFVTNGKHKLWRKQLQTLRMLASEAECSETSLLFNDRKEDSPALSKLVREACVHGNTTHLSRLIDEKVLSQSDFEVAFLDSGYSALHMACLAGRLTVVEFLLTRFPLLNPQPNENGITPLLALTAQPLDSSSPESRTKHERIQVDICRRLARWYEDRVKVKEENVTVTDVFCARTSCEKGLGMTALHFAVLRGKSRLVAYLVRESKLVEVDTRGGPNYSTALHLAASESPSLVRQLVADCGAEVNALTADGNSSLILACHSLQEPSVVEVLLNHGADLKHANRFGYNAIHAVVNAIAPKTAKAERKVRRASDLIKVLVSRGGKELLDSRSREGTTPRELLEKLIVEWEKQCCVENSHVLGLLDGLIHENIFTRDKSDNKD